MMATIPNKAESIKARALSFGYTGCGIIPVDFYQEFHDELERRSRLFPHSAFFYDLIKPMAQVLDKIPWAKSIVVGLRRYDRDYALPEGVDRLIGKYYLVDGRLPSSKEFANQAALTEYMKTLDLQAVPAPMVPARWSAVRAGLGKFRNNNFVYTEKGSWNWTIPTPTCAPWLPGRWRISAGSAGGSADPQALYGVGGRAQCCQLKENSTPTPSPQRKPGSSMNTTSHSSYA